jgi:tetratricopeptide (TPR) repeat protein
MDSRGNSDAAVLAGRVVAQAVGQALLSVGVPGGDAVIEALLGELLGVQDDQAAAVGRIDRAVQLLVDEPWKTARGLIREASLPGSAMNDRRTKLLEAASALRRAISLQPERSFAQAYASLDLAIVLRMLGDLPASQFHAEEALVAAAGYLRDVADWALADRARAQQQSQLPEWRQVLGAASEYLRTGRPASPAWEQPIAWRREIRYQFAGVARAVANLGLVLSNRSDLTVLDQRWRDAFPWDLSDPGDRRPAPSPALIRLSGRVGDHSSRNPAVSSQLSAVLGRESSLLPSDLRHPRTPERPTPPL